VSFWKLSNKVVLEEDTSQQDGDISVAPAAATAYATGKVGMYTSGSAVFCGTAVWSAANWFDGVARSCAGAAGAPVPTVLYGSFTGAAPVVGAGGNSPLPLQPRYLIELIGMRNFSGKSYVGGSSGGESVRVMFRITATGFGRIPGLNGAPTSVTLQSIFAPS
jgi:type IV pilus assembly protein PilX